MITSDHPATRPHYARPISLADLEKLTAGLNKDTRIVPNRKGNLTLLNNEGQYLGWIDLHLPEHISGHAIHLGEAE
jgi:hypothetical protein